MITIRPKSIEERIAEVEAKYQAKFDAYDKLILTIIRADGANQETKIGEIQMQALQASELMDLEILEILGGAE